MNDIPQRRTLWVLVLLLLSFSIMLCIQRDTSVETPDVIGGNAEKIEASAGVSFAATEQTSFVNEAKEIKDGSLDVQIIRERGYILFGVDGETPPYNWFESQKNKTNSLVLPYTSELVSSSLVFADGYDVYVAQKIADALYVDFYFVSVDRDSSPDALYSGRVDCILACDGRFFNDILLVAEGYGWDTAIESNSKMRIGLRNDSNLGNLIPEIISNINDEEKSLAMNTATEKWIEKVKLTIE